MRQPAAIALLTVLAVAACSSPAASRGPTPTSASTAGATLPTGSDLASPTASAPAPSTTPAPIPLAEIVTADASIAGHIGTYDIDGRGSDSPALPFDTLPSVVVGKADVLSLQFVDRVAIGDHQVVITTATDTNGSSPQEIGRASCRERV